MPEPAKRPRVMIVEDFVLIQESIRVVLEGECDVLATAEDGETALAAVAELRPDIVTLDVSLPGFSGFALAEKFSETAPATKVVFITAHTDRTYIERAFEVGAKGYVLKGAIQTELTAAIRQVSAGGRYLSPLLRARVNLNLNWTLPAVGGSQPPL
jgi:two-component system response regulator DesR